MSEPQQHCLIARSQLPRDSCAAGLLADSYAAQLACVTHLEMLIHELVTAWSR